MVSTVAGVPRPRTEDTFSRFYGEHWRNLAALALAMTRDQAVATDLAQEAMTRVFARWGTLRDPFPYALRITHNLAVDVIRKRSREHLVAEPPEEAAPVAADPGVLDLVLRLPEGLREVVLLHYVLDLPVATVADVIRRPVGTVKRRLHEARAHLAETLGAIDES